jgi:MFS family permease
MRTIVDGLKKPQASLIYLLFFFSGVSGLIYEVIWVRMFGNLFGNTIYSAAIVTSVFMLGLGVGSYFAGIWLGSLAGGYSVTRWGKPLERYMLVQALFIFSTPFLLVAFNGSVAEAYLMKRILQLLAAVGLPRLTQIWGVMRPILAVSGLPSLMCPPALAWLMRFSTPGMSKGRWSNIGGGWKLPRIT